MLVSGLPSPQETPAAAQSPPLPRAPRACPELPPLVAQKYPVLVIVALYDPVLVPLHLPCEITSPGCWPGIALLGLGIRPAPIPCWRLPAAVSGPAHHGGRCTHRCAAGFTPQRCQVGACCSAKARSDGTGDPKAGRVSNLTVTRQPFAPAHSSLQARGPAHLAPAWLSVHMQTQSRWPWPVLQSRCLLMQDTGSVLPNCGHRGIAMSYWVGVEGGAGCHRVAWKGHVSAHLPTCPVSPTWRDCPGEATLTAGNLAR